MAIITDSVVTLTNMCPPFAPDGSNSRSAYHTSQDRNGRSPSDGQLDAGSEISRRGKNLRVRPDAVGPQSHFGKRGPSGWVQDTRLLGEGVRTELAAFPAWIVGRPSKPGAPSVYPQLDRGLWWTVGDVSRSSQAHPALKSLVF